MRRNKILLIITSFLIIYSIMIIYYNILDEAADIGSLPVLIIFLAVFISIPCALCYGYDYLINMIEEAEDEPSTFHYINKYRIRFIILLNDFIFLAPYFMVLYIKSQIKK